MMTEAISRCLEVTLLPREKTKLLWHFASPARVDDFQRNRVECD